MANAILIKSGGGGVTSADVTLTSEYMLEGKTSLTMDSDDEIVEGRMKDIGAESKTLNAGESHTITKGHHNGNGVIKAKDLASQTSGTATIAHILQNQTAWVNGKQLAGAMPDNGAVSKELTPGGSYTITKGYHNGNGKVTAQSLATICSGCNVTNAHILSGYKGYGKNGELYTGSIASLAGGTYGASQSQKTISCKGKYMTSDIVISATNVQSIISFSFASRNYATANFKWQNPSTGPFYGIVVRGKQGGYPTSATDSSSSLIYSGYGTNANASGTSYSGYKNVGTGTWYFSAYSYYILDGKNIYSSAKQASATFNCYNCSEHTDCDQCDGNCRQCHECECNCNDGCGDAAGGCAYDCCECCNWINTEYGCSDCNDYYCSKSYPAACNGNS